jgi:transcriptional regulator with XRE-family HTH domain
MDLAARLAESLRRLREQRGLTQTAMAERLGISRPTLNRLESASQNTTLLTLGQLCRSLRCRPGDLFEPSRWRLRGRLRSGEPPP